MKEFNDILTQLDKTLNGIMFFNEVLTALLVFLLSYVALFLLGVTEWFGAVPAIVYLAISIHIKIRENKLRWVEIKYKKLDEKLRTAADNQSYNNEFVNALKKEIVSEAKNMDLGSFLDVKKTSTKIGGSIVLCFMILLLVSFGIRTPDLLHKVADYTSDILDTGEKEGDADNIISGGGPQGVGLAPGDDNIYGYGNIAQLGEEQVEFQLSAEAYEINVRDVKEVIPKNFEEGAFPSDVYITTSEAYEENIPREQQQIVSNYFKSLSK